jgi:type IV secretion system protein VirB9
MDGRTAVWTLIRGARVIALLACATCHPQEEANAETLPPRGPVDSRIRIVAYNENEVYRLPGYVGYQIDLQFEPGETFVGLGAGDLEGLSFLARDNHLFLKPRAAKVGTNLTVLTTRRHYQFDYTASRQQPDPLDAEVIYSLRFTYPPPPGSASQAAVSDRIESRLGETASTRPSNIDYWYCGAPQIKPVAVADDAVHTRIRFGPRGELPALFVSNEDGSESLLNFSMDAGDVIVHRVARRLIVRRGKLVGCIVNKAYVGAGERLDSGTVAPTVERVTKEGRP